MEDIKRLLAKTGELTLTQQERAMMDDLPAESRDIANVFRADMALRRKALEQVILEDYKRHYREILASGVIDEILPIYKKIHEEEDKLDDVLKSDYMFITISPQELKMKPFELLKYMERIVKFSWIKRYCYVLEQRFNGVPDEKYKELGSGIHSHLLIRKDYKLSHVKRDINRVFKSINTNIDFKLIKEKDLIKVQGYMTGDKKEEFKQIKQEQDRIWRDKEGIKHYYGEEFL